jgi:hypothetical protein
MIEELRYLLKSDPGLYLAQVTEVSDLDQEKSEYLAKLKLLPDRGEFVAPQAFGDEKLQVGDVVFLAIPADEPEYAYVMFVIPNTANTLHARTDVGGRVLKSRPGKKLHLVSDTKITIGKGMDTEEAEPLLLGAVTHSYFGTIVTRILAACDQVKAAADQVKAVADALKTGPIADTCAPGSPVAPGAAIITAMGAASLAATNIGTAITDLKSSINSDKSTYLDDANTNIKSQIAFTERGGS